MSYDERKVDETCLALLRLTSFKHRGVTRAWKGMAWEVLDRLHEQGWIYDPRSKAKSVVFTDEGLQRSQELFEELFRG